MNNFYSEEEITIIKLDIGMFSDQTLRTEYECVQDGTFHDWYVQIWFPLLEQEMIRRELI